MRPSELRAQWKGKEQRMQWLEIILYLSLATLFFRIFANNMVMFGVFVYIGVAWLIYKTPNRKLCLVTGIIGGTIGFCTEWWGCPNLLWHWTEPCITIWMVFGQPNGFPIEVVIAYFSAGFWIGKVTLILFEPQVDEIVDFYENKGYSDTLKIRLIIAIIIDVVCITVLSIEIMYIQSMLLLAIGSNIFLTLPKKIMGLVLPFALFMGLIGFFFENFATGIIPGFSVWVYDVSLYENLAIPNPVIGVAPISAFFAYTGCGLIIFSSAFALNKFLN